jgi:hypothetical protein
LTHFCAEIFARIGCRSEGRARRVSAWLVRLLSAPLGTVLIILIQLNYAVAPRLPVLSRL